MDYIIADRQKLLNILHHINQNPGGVPTIVKTELVSIIEGSRPFGNTPEYSYDNLVKLMENRV